MHELFVHLGSLMSLYNVFGMFRYFCVLESAIIQTWMMILIMIINISIAKIFIYKKIE